MAPTDTQKQQLRRLINDDSSNDKIGTLENPQILRKAPFQDTQTDKNDRSHSLHRRTEAEQLVAEKHKQLLA